VVPSRRQPQRPPGSEAGEPVFGVELVEQTEQVVLVRAAPVEQDERTLGLARGRADAVDERIEAHEP
jgi:hypothetical protein